MNLPPSHLAVGPPDLPEPETGTEECPERPPPLPTLVLPLPQAAQGVARAGEPTPRVPLAGPQLRTLAWTTRTFGPDWRWRLHFSHNLFAANPALFCDWCGRYVANRAHEEHLQQPCLTEPLPGTSHYTRWQKLRAQRNPLPPHDWLDSPVNLLVAAQRHFQCAQQQATCSYAS